MGINGRTLLRANKVPRKRAFIYVLKCSHDTFYVGFSRQLHYRLRQHFEGRGAYFTKQHPPLRLLEYRPARSERDEYKLWIEYASIYGTASVGGWSPFLCEKFNFVWTFDHET